MQDSDTYKTIEGIGEGIYKEKGSKFVAKVIAVESEEEIREQLEIVKKDHYQARHHCYAYQLGKDYASFRANDDGEPSGSAGKPIYNQILSKELTNTLVVVTRYFGGTKLGVSGLVTAYKTSTREALENVSIVEKKIEDFFEIIYAYEETNEVMKLISHQDINVISQVFDMKCTLVFSIRKRDSDAVVKKITENNKLDLNYLKTV
jgi:uncharacterized YigZ family protein